MKIHPQRFKALFSLFSLNLSCFNIACIKNIKATMVAPLIIGLMDGRNPRICCLIKLFKRRRQTHLSPSPKLGDLIPQKKQLMFTVNAKSHMFCVRKLLLISHKPCNTGLKNAKMGQVCSIIAEIMKP